MVVITAMRTTATAELKTHTEPTLSVPVAVTADRSNLTENGRKVLLVAFTVIACCLAVLRPEWAELFFAQPRNDSL